MHEAASCVAITSCLAHNADGSTLDVPLKSPFCFLQILVSYPIASHYFFDFENGLESIFYNNWRGHSYVVLWKLR